MGFLYGDSTPSPLESNFLELLRDALDFSVVLLRADENVRALVGRKHADSRAATQETARLNGFGAAVAEAVQGAPKGDAGSETSHCAALVAKATTDAVSASIEAVRAWLATRVAHSDAEEAAEREAAFKALEALLLPHMPPGADVVVRVERDEAAKYAAHARGESTFGLAWRTHLTIPEGSAFTAPAPIERLVQHVEIGAPSPTGWLKKELKVRPQRLDRLVLKEVADDGKSVAIKLRVDPGSEQGFDFVVHPTAGVASAARTGAEGLADGPFDLSEEDVPKLVTLAEKMRAAIAEMKGERLVDATFGEADFRAHPLFEDVVVQLVGVLAPIVQEIARHSLSQSELVIRRQLSSERREELFVAKSALREKIAHLPAAQQALFNPLGLDAQALSLSQAPQPPQSLRPVTDHPPVARSEVPRSEPPPPRSSAPPPPDPLR